VLEYLVTGSGNSLIFILENPLFLVNKVQTHVIWQKLPGERGQSSDWIKDTQRIRLGNVIKRL
jgi:hypothetical protein